MEPKRIRFAITSACSANQADIEWTAISLEIQREFDFEDPAQCRKLLARLESARNLFFEEKQK